MSFPLINWFFHLLWPAFFLGHCLGSTKLSAAGPFAYQNLLQCRRNEFYDLDYFSCMPCIEDGTDGVGVQPKLQPSADKFFCQCTSGYTPFYEVGKYWPTCLSSCSKDTTVTTTTTSTVASTSESPYEITETLCNPIWQETPTQPCNYQYLNSTTASGAQIPGLQQIGTIILTKLNIVASNVSDCLSCDPTYNFIYQGYCIANPLLRPYLHYNFFWQSTTTTTSSNKSSRSTASVVHFGELKFVAFFCLALRNATACNQLANLCVLSHYSLDKHSPCSAFLLTQVSDVVVKYSNAGEQLRDMQPFVFYKKGKATSKLLATPLEQRPYSLSDKDYAQNHLQLFSTSFNLAGNLQRWGSFGLRHVNLCQLYGASSSMLQHVRFAQRLPDVSCQLTLEQLLDLATLQANDNFISVYINYTKSGEAQVHLQPVPVLIETLTPENQRLQREDWQLIKRFLLIEAQPRQLYHTLSSYEDAHKLQLYRSLRYVEQLELHYDIHDGNRIGLPLLKLRYRHIELTANATLQQLYSYSVRVRFQRLQEGTQRQILLEVTLPLLLLFALVAALFRVRNIRRRRMPTELCEVNCLLELLLHLANNVALALLATALMQLFFNSLEFGVQQFVKITLPLLKHEGALAGLIYPACMLQFGFLVVQLWRASQMEIFLIDWERPRSCEQNHLNLKSNLETSSVCSSVRTYVAENNVSAWRVLFTANEWIRLSVTQKYSSLLQVLVVICVFQWLNLPTLTHEDLSLRCCLLGISYLGTYLAQLLLRKLLVERFFGEPLQKFIDLCSLANISLFSLLEPGFGYYIHGRSPHGFADTDMSSMIIQLQREAQNMCGRRGLLMDSDKQAYIILPPRNLRIYLERLLLPYQRSNSLSQAFYQKDIPTIDGSVERTTIAYASVNRFFCAFIDHAIKDMDYIIKEKSFVEKMLNCEIDNYLTENKGTFYIDDALSFGRVLLLGNHVDICVLELLLLLSTFLLTKSILVAAIVVCGFNALLKSVYRYWMRRNVSRKTLIDQRFLL